MVNCQRKALRPDGQIDIMAKLKVGVIGCGGIANGKHLPSLQKQGDRVELVAFCDLIVERAEHAAATYGAEGAKVYVD